MEKPIDFSSQIGLKYKVIERDRITYIELSEIGYLDCDGYITNIHLVDGSVISVAKLLKKFEEELNEFGFIRANRNVLVNLFHVDCIHIGKGQRKLIVNGVSINISRRNLYKFK